MKIAIIGAGIAGLYLGYKLKKNNKMFDIYEKNSRIGGRIKTINFCGKTVVAGAGIGRTKKDILLTRFLKNLKVKMIPFQSHLNYTFKHVDILKINKLLLKEYNKLKNQNIRAKFTFEQFGKKILGKDLYSLFIKSVGGTDYEKADVYDTIKDYGFDDYVHGLQGFYINWNEMLEKLQKILQKNLILKKSITSIIYDETRQQYKLNGKYYYDKVVFATPIDTIRKLISFSLFNQIQCQSFVRIYVKLNKPLPLGDSIITEKPFQRIIEMDREKFIYMISFCDNEIAENWLKVKNRRSYIENHLKTLFHETFEVKNEKLIYWKCGTHYFTPLPTKFKSRTEFLKIVQQPQKNLFCIGEAFSKNQGWCEGALESVEKIYEQLLF